MFAAAGYAGIQLIAMLTAVGSCAFVLRSQPPNDEDEEQYLDEKLACYAYAAQMQITDIKAVDKGGDGGAIDSN